ncbi:MAG: hypothetical protein ABL996_17815, partial [Micropepsaceae bacterium]
MLSVAEAQAKVIDGLKPLASEQVPLGSARGRVLSADVAAQRTQPPFDVSAMDGYAVRAQDVATLPASLKNVGTVAAGALFQGSVGKSEAIRFFTGAPVPKGATSADELARLRWLTEKRIERELETVPGVAAVQVRGGIQEE